MSYYDSISDGYDELYAEEQLSKAKVIAEALNCEPDELLLDVGCGSACYFGLFDCVKVGVDPSFELVSKAGDGFFVQAAGEELPFVDDCFDFVISVTALHNFSDFRRGLSEIARVAKSRVVLSVLKRSEGFGDMREAIMAMFSVVETIDADKDLIYVCNTKT